jgi:Na+/glutamate symporter
LVKIWWRKLANSPQLDVFAAWNRKKGLGATAAAVCKIKTENESKSSKWFRKGFARVFQQAFAATVQGSA